MTTLALDDLQRTRFEWPEPLVLEMLGEAYRAGDDGGRWMAAQAHARFLRTLVGQDGQAKPSDRLDLMALCEGRGIDAETIEAAEQAVFDELSRLVLMRFRNSPRLATRYLAQLHGARSALPMRAEPTRKPAPKPVRRAPLRLRSSFAAIA